MKINNQLVVRKIHSNYQFMWRTMRITLFMLTAFLLQVSAKTNAQVNLNEKNASLRTIIKSITKQTGYDFVYADRDLEKTKPVSLQLKNSSLEEALARSFAGQPLAYKISNKTVVLKRKDMVKIVDHNQYKNIEDLTQQEFQVRGTVLDNNGEPLEGVTIVAMRATGVATGAKTGSAADGSFTLSNVAINGVVEFSYLGRKTRILPARSQMGNISLEMVTSELEDIVVVSTGYQTLPKERATGAFDLVDKKTLETPSISLANKLVGAVSGLQPTLNADGSVASFVLRGQGTFSGSQPLLVVDGFAISGGFSSINPDDIESVSVLKDAAAASIWGA